MAKIIKTTDQEQALEVINASLKALRSVNTFLGDEVKVTGNVTLTITSGKRKATIDRYSGEDVVKILSEYRKSAVSKIRMLSKKYAIALDEGEESILEPKKQRVDKQAEETNNNPLDASDGGFEKVEA